MPQFSVKKPLTIFVAAIAVLVLGIVALVFMCVWYISIPCSIVGVILAGLAMNKAKAVGMKSGVAVAGVVCSCIALGLTIAIYLLAIIGLAELSSYAYYY